jgi:hypothetical protein
MGGDPPSSLTPARHCLGDDHHCNDCHRIDDRVHRDAADRRRSRRTAALQLGLFLVSIDADGNDGGLWQSGGHLWPQAGHVRRNRHFSPGIAVGWLRLVHAGDDCFSAHPRRWRRGDAAGRDDHRGGPVPGSRTRQGTGLSGERVGGGGGGWARLGGTHHSLGVLVMDLLDQHSRGNRGRRRLPPVSQREPAASAARHRSGRYRFVHRRSHVAVGRADRTGQPSPGAARDGGGLVLPSCRLPCGATGPLRPPMESPCWPTCR